MGVGECVAEEHPYYLPETNGTVAHVIKDFLAPLVFGHTFESPAETDALFAEIRGHEMAKATLEMAIWDLFANARGESLTATLGGEAKDTIPAGVSIGLQESIVGAPRTRANRSGRGLSADQDQDQAGQGRRSRPRDSKGIPKDPAHGRRQQRVHASKTRTPCAASMTST